jgi:hypothetical protein
MDTKNTHHTEEDFLEVDKSIPGQNFVCLSFVSPEKTLINKEQWMFYQYHQYVVSEYNKIFTELTEKLLDTEDDTIPVDGVADLVERMGRVFNMNEVEYRKWSELINDYKFKEGERLDKVFDEMNNFQTSVRGVKVRGVYDTYREAEVRSKVLQRQDSRFDVFIGQVGYWLPWHPDVNRIQDQEYMNEELNTLMKEYKNNEAKRDMFYEQQKQERVQEAREQVERVKRLQEEKRKIENITEEDEKEDEKEDDKDNEGTTITSNGLGEHGEIVGTMEEATSALVDLDPWMKRKMEQQDIS